MKKNWRLHDSKLTLRPLALSDLPMTRQWRNDNREQFLNPEPISIDQHQAWFADYIKREDDFVFIIEVHDEPVGQCSLYKVDWQSHEAEFGRLLIVPSHRRTGVARQAIRLLLQAAVGEGIRTFYLQVRETNKTAIRLYTSCRFDPILTTDGVLTMRCCG